MRDHEDRPPFRVGDRVKKPTVSDREFVVLKIRHLAWKRQWTMDLGVAGEIEPEVILGNQYVTSDWKRV